MNIRLNLQIAVKVMQWIPWRELRQSSGGPYIEIIWQKPGEREPWTKLQPINQEAAQQRSSLIALEDIDPHKHSLSYVPDFAGNIAAAWTVVEKMGLTMTLCLVGGRPAGDWECELYTKGNPRSLAMEVANGKANTAPLAICLAALSACGVIVPEEAKG